MRQLGGGVLNTLYPLSGVLKAAGFQNLKGADFSLMFYSLLNSKLPSFQALPPTEFSGINH